MNKNSLEKFNRDLDKVSFNVPRIVIGGTNSGTGKTTITCAILMALKNRGYNLHSYKCGPDYIDPMFHKKVLNIPSTNMDLFFSDRETALWILKETVINSNIDMAVCEGVMGYYDGISGTTPIASTYHLAHETDSPAILVVDGKGKSLSLVAEIKGFLEYRKDSKIKGVIINRISKSMYSLLKPLIEKELNIEVFGFFESMENVAFESRHLGLVTANEIENLEEILDNLAANAEKTLEIDRIIDLANGVKPLEFSVSSQVEILEEEKKKLSFGEGKTLEQSESLEQGESLAMSESLKKVRIGVAKDKAFCFYYDENLKILEALGCQLVEFSPLCDSHLPENLSGILLGGGYPELYGKMLEANVSMRNEMMKALEGGMPCLAECGGFMYLHEEIISKEGESFKMVGALKGKCFPLEKMGRFGYIDLTFNEDTFLGSKGESVKGHEFHYWESENPGNVLHGKKPLGKRNWDCAVTVNNIFAGFPHLYYWSNPKIPGAFVKKAKEYFEKFGRKK